MTDKARIEMLTAALKALAGDYCGTPCWCGMAIDNPMIKSHSAACRLAQAAVAGSERQAGVIDALGFNWQFCCKCHEAQNCDLANEYDKCVECGHLYCARCSEQGKRYLAKGSKNAISKKRK